MTIPVPEVARPSPVTAPAEARSRIDLVFLGLLILGTAVRIAYAISPHVHFGDESCYVMLARNLFSGNGYTYYAGRSEVHFPPLFPIALGILHTVGFDWYAVTRAAFVIFGSAAIVPVYLLGRSIYSRRVGRLAALIVALLPAYTSGILFGQTMGEPLFLFFLLLGIYAAHRASREQGVRFYVLSGAMFCLAYLTRPEAILHTFVTFIFLTGYLLFRMPLRPRAAGLRLLAFWAAFLVLASPYVLYLNAVTGKWALTTKDTTSYTTTRALVGHEGEKFQLDTWGLNEKGEIKYFAHEESHGLLALLTGPYRGRVLHDLRTNLATLMSSIRKSKLFGYVLLFLSILGFLGSPWRRTRTWSELYHILLLLPTSVFLLFFIADRLLYPALIPLILWAAAGADHILHWIESTDLPGILDVTGGRRVLKGLCIAVISAYLVNRGWFYFSLQRGEQDEVWAASAWLRENTPEDSIVMSTGPEVAFHAGRRWLPVPFAPIPELVAYARTRNADYICLRGRYLAVRLHQRVELFYNAKDREGLELLERSGWTPKNSFVVYRVKKQGV